MSQKLRGLAGQSMRGQKPNKIAQQPYIYPNAGSYTFTAPKAGQWKFVLWGSGGFGVDGVSAGASCSYSEITRRLTVGATVAVVVSSSAGGDSTATFLDGKVVTAGGATLTTAGVATGGDVNLAGTAGVLTGSLPGSAGLGTAPGLGGAAGGGKSGGAGAPGNTPYQGAAGQPGASGTSVFSGVGAGGNETGSIATAGQGLVLAVYLRP